MPVITGATSGSFCSPLRAANVDAFPPCAATMCTALWSFCSTAASVEVEPKVMRISESSGACGSVHENSRPAGALNVTDVSFEPSSNASTSFVQSRSESANQSWKRSRGFLPAR